MCKHDPLYRINNEAAGGAGCPICAAEKRRLVMVSRNGKVDIDPEWRRGWIDKDALQSDIDRYGERGAGMAGNEPERCESGGFG